MITQISVKHFKSIFNVQFEPGMVNVLIGANGSGKSALLEAIGVLSAAIGERVDDSSLQSRVIKNISPSIDLLVIHVDADISRESELNCFAPCPPAEETVNHVKAKIMQWLNEGELPNDIICCIPCDNTEAWVLAAYDTNSQYHNPPVIFLECVEKPDYIISDPRKRFCLLKRKDGKPKKTKRVYRDVLCSLCCNAFSDFRIVSSISFLSVILLPTA